MKLKHKRSLLGLKATLNQKEKSISRNLLKKILENGENTGKVREFYQSEKVGTLILLWYIPSKLKINKGIDFSMNLNKKKTY